MANDIHNDLEDFDLEEAKKMKKMREEDEDDNEEAMDEEGKFPNPRGKSMSDTADAIKRMSKMKMAEAKKCDDKDKDDDDDDEDPEDMDVSEAKKEPFARSFRQPGQKSKEDLRKLADKAVKAGKGKTVKEETLAATTIRAHKTADAGNDDSKSLSASKIGMMTSMMGMMSTMQKDDMTAFFDKVQDLYHKGKDWGVGDESGHNKHSIDATSGAASGASHMDPMPKLDSKNHWLEDVEAVFQGQELSEEFRDNVATIFGAAVEARVIAEEVRLQEAYELKLQEEVAIFHEEVTSKLDTYLDYVVDEFMKENEVAIESSLRNELAEEFMEGLKNLFAEHYISVPEDKVDVLEAMTEKVAELEAMMDEVITENVDLKNQFLEVSKEEIFEEVASDLALTQKEKFAALAEGIEFDGDLETYGKKLMIVKENYFKPAAASASNIEEETFEGAGETKYVDPRVSAYVNSLSRTVKR